MKTVNVWCVLVFLFAGCGSERLNYEQLDKALLSYAQVGSAHMPEEIAEVNSPYFDAVFQRPDFPPVIDSVFPGDDIQPRIDALANIGGGTLIVKVGNHFTGRLELKSNIHLYLEEDALIEFKSEIEAFLPVVFTRNEGIELYSLGACIYANNAKNIAITGKGKLIGPGKGKVRERTMTHDVIENLVLADTPVENRIYDGKTADYIFPPALIAPINCENVFIEGISLERSAFWNIVPTYCENVIIRGVNIHSIGIQRGDGIDIESSRNVLIEYCTFNTGDDCIALKAGRGDDGLRVNRPTENVVVRYCLAERGHGGLTVGSETAGQVQQVYVHDCAFDGTDVGIRFKTRRPRGGGGNNMFFENIRMNVVHSALRWDMLGSATHVGNAASRDHQVKPNRLTPRFSDITIRKVLIEKAADCIKIDGIPESMLENVRFSNIHAAAERYFVAKDAKDIIIENSSINCVECEIDTVNVSGLNQRNVEFIN
ncbi:glycoside hydrolase family 28 protein [Sphingobacterium olei]|uniref:Glycoside hydrolase family 28 protein n=1 Tax=Sphingobacterium olei TaxID=2571155 RepID=A0A4U0PH43_9SPHI|nr:glycoside hydrolase family 28 protein [Sphingobacterium olei]TJZ62134.1 glycoside hydrolase family 28 protein [Sphingobacterium olei]